MPKLDLKGVYSLRKEFAPGGANSFIKELSPLRGEAETKFADLPSLNLFPFHLNNGIKSRRKHCKHRSDNFKENSYQRSW